MADAATVSTTVSTAMTREFAHQLPVAAAGQDVPVVASTPTALGSPNGFTRSSPSDLKPPSTVASSGINTIPATRNRIA